jgi:hypothetical protein
MIIFGKDIVSHLEILLGIASSPSLERFMILISMLLVSISGLTIAPHLEIILAGCIGCDGDKGTTEIKKTRIHYYLQSKGHREIWSNPSKGNFNHQTILVYAFSVQMVPLYTCFFFIAKQGT